MSLTPALFAPRTRRRWLAAVAVRVVLGLAGLGLTPLLFREDLAALVAIRPTREFLLLGGFQVRDGELSLALLVLAALPVFLVGNWIFFGLGRAYRDELTTDELPDWITGSVDPEQIARLRGVLRRRGTLLVVLARVAIFPATLLAAAAGASDLSLRRFLVADTVGASLALAGYVGAGYALGSAHETAGPWITGAGALGLLVILYVAGRALRHGDEPVDAPVAADPEREPEPGPTPA